MEFELGSLWTEWHAHPEVVLGLLLVQGAYLLGVGPLRERYDLAEGVEPRQVATFSAGILVIFVAILSPLHVLSDEVLFSAHMVQHVLITLVAPPLLILGTPDWLIRPLLRPNWAFRTARLVTLPLLAFFVFNFLFSIWHVPALYESAIRNNWLHIIEHTSMTATGLMMWWPLVSLMPELPRLSYLFQLVYLFLLSVAQIIIFATITFAQKPIYEVYANSPHLWLSPLADQQVGGIIMKVGGGAIFLTLFVVVFFKWYNQEEIKRKTEIAAREYFES